MLVVGVTGGIGAGKSAVSGLFAGLGARIIDADAVARQVVAEDPGVLVSLGRAFGEDIRTADGSLDRRELGRRAFRSEQARRRLNDILHPPILARIEQMLTRLRGSGYEGIVVLDAALLVECNVLGMVDRLVVVRAREGIRRQRLMENKGFTEEEFNRRAAAQLPAREKSKLAHYVIDNDGTMAELRERVREVWDRLQTDAAGRGCCP
jgi:dephospho-CoA kinase